jgi:polyferredoxin
MLLVLAGAWSWGVATRAPFLTEVLRDRNALYRIAADNSIENAYTLKIVNKTDVTATYTLTLGTAPAGARIAGVPPQIVAPAGEVISVPLKVVAPAGTSGRHDLVFTVDGGATTGTRTTESSFFAPAQ